MKIEDCAGLMFWKSAQEDVRSNARGCLAEVIHAHCDALVATFYEVFLQDKEGAAFLSNDVVQERLGYSMAGWLHQLADTDLHGDIAEFAALQSKIGMVHARLKVPNHLVMQGASLLKSRIACHIAELPLAPGGIAAAIILMDELMDFATGMMSEAYVIDSQRRARTDEAYRLFALGQDINLERETQRAALMEWSQSILFSLLGGQARSDILPLGSSPFGLWVRHRAAILFPGSPLLASIETLISVIDQECLPAVLDRKPRSVESLSRLQERIEEIKFLLNDLFQAAANLENGRDPLTRALNRRFLPSVLGREIALAKNKGLPLTIALVDVDYFKQVNDRFGHSAGDQVLSHVADTILNMVRQSDFVFRYGGEEFLIAFAETEMAEAMRVAERIRRQFADNSFGIGDNEALSITVSIGLASFEGHPDYEYLIKSADAALYQAKEAGRNRVVEAVRRKAA